MPGFPDGFRWGYSSSAYQVEGAVTEDGRGLSVWDTFCARPGAIDDGESGRIACDHYHRWREDIALLAASGANTYRFSIAWPRIQPNGRGPANDAGIGFYDRLIDNLLAAGIAPVACLHHWDMPQALEDRGGWSSRDTPLRFQDYAAIIARRLGDRLDWLTTLNEPATVMWAGHTTGRHAPGHASRSHMLSAMHGQNLAHGRAVEAIRAERPALPVGTVLNLQPAIPDRDDAGCIEAAEIMDDLWNRSFLDPLFHRRYPERIAEWLGESVREGDLELIGQPIDRLGVNYYTRGYCWPDPDNPAGIGFRSHAGGDTRLTHRGWEIDGQGLQDALVRLKEEYGNPPVTICENGAAFDDRPESGNRVRDDARIGYFRDHLGHVAEAIARGARVEGYLAWTLVDNFEWALGYTMRFGTVWLDRATQTRIPKDSYAFLREVFTTGEIV